MRSLKIEKPLYGRLALNRSTHLHRGRSLQTRCGGDGTAAKTARARQRLEVLDDVALDRDVGTRRDRRPVVVVRWMLLRVSVVPVVLTMLRRRRRQRVVRPSLGQKLLEYRQDGHVEQLALGQRVHPRHAGTAERRRQTGRVRRRPAARRSAGLAPPAAVVHVRGAVHVRRRRSPEPGAAIPGRRRRRPGTGSTAGPALHGHRTVHGTARVQRRRTVVLYTTREMNIKRLVIFIFLFFFFYKPR